MGDPSLQIPTSSTSDRRKRHWLGVGIKALITAALVTWLVRSGALDFSILMVLFRSKRVLVITVTSWLILMVGMTTVRWIVLLHIVGAKVTFPRALALQTMALFFNGVVPGNVGGDLLKNQVILGNQGAKLLMLTLVERIIGLIALIWVGTFGIALSWDRLKDDRGLLILSGLLIAMMLGSIIGPAILLRFLPTLEREKKLPPQKSDGLLLRLRHALGQSLHSMIESLHLLKDAKGQLFKVFAISFTMQCGNIFYFLFFSRELGNPDASFAQLSLIFPLGMLSLVLPVSISGMGLGHLMFDQLFRLLGLKGGANVFNVFILAHLSLSLIGALPYVFMRSAKKKQRASPVASVTPDST